MFRALRSHNFRMWSAGAALGNTGTWMQRMAQDWLVLTQLSHNDPRPLGIITALQFVPQLALLPLTSRAADHIDNRKLLMVTQSTLGVLALALGLVVLTGAATMYHVYGFSVLLGCTTAFDAPVRHAFVANLVSDADLSNAVALNFASFNAARFIGPAVAGVLIEGVGPAGVFFINAVSFGAVLLALAAMRTAEFRSTVKPECPTPGFLEALRYLGRTKALHAPFFVIFLFGTFGLNYPLLISVMAVNEFHLTASSFGLLTSAMGVGSLCGAILAARRSRATLVATACGAAAFGIATGLAALAPTYGTFGLVLMAVGMAAQTVSTSTTALVQLATNRHLRGRIMALFIAVAVGGQPLGAPLLGWLSHTHGPRLAMAVAAAAGLIAAAASFYSYVRATKSPGRSFASS